MSPSRSPSSTRGLFALVFACGLLAAPAVQAGPPLLCHPFATGGAPSLPWGTGWNARADRYDTARLAADTLRLLDASAPVIARMETLRRAAIYAGGDRAALRSLWRGLEARIARGGDPAARAMALFDAGYFAETLQDVVRLQGYDMPGVGRVDAPAIEAMLAGADGSRRIAEALALRGGDASMRFAAALVSAADRRDADRDRHARVARAHAGADRLLSLNIGLLRE